MSDRTRTKERKRPTKGDLVKRVILVFAVWTAFGLAVRVGMQVFAAEPATGSFNQTWTRTDDPVASGLVDRTWMWGPDGFTEAMVEPYADAPNGERTVQYFDKSRMEDNGFRASAPWDVTNGLLVVELVTGRMQVGDDDFVQHDPAAVNVAGDQDVVGVQYATLAALLDEPALADGSTITQHLDSNGSVTDDPSLVSYGVTAVHRVQVPGIDHQVASPFWAFMNSSGTIYENGAYIDAPMFLSPFYATGYPITEAYWANVKVGDVYQDVLLQCFERRCLTYTPGNPAGWQVEAGNVGQHYYQWRYGQVSDDEPTATAPPAATPPASSPAEPTPSVTPNPTVTATPEPALEYDFLGKFGERWDPATIIDRPRGVAAGDGYVYTVEFGGSRVQKFTYDGILVDSWDGFSNPVDVAVGPDGNIWVADTNNGVVKKYSPDGTFLTQLGTFGFTCDPGYFVAPSGIAFSNNGQIYIVDRGLHRIQRFNANGTHIATYGDPNCTSGSGNNEFDRPQSIAFDANNNFYVTDKGNNRVIKFNAAGTYITEWGSQGGLGLSGDGDFDNPDGIAVSPAGRVYVVDSGNDRVQGFDLNGGYLGEFGLPGTDPGYFGEALGIDIDEDGYVYVADFDNGNVQKFDGVGNFVDIFNDNRRSHLGDVSNGMTLDAAGNVYVVDDTFNRVLKFDHQGNYLLEFGELGTGPAMLDEPVDAAASPDGHLYIVDVGTDRVLKYTQDGEFVTYWGGNGQGNGQFIDPYGLAVDDVGSIYVADSGNNRIQKFSGDGQHLSSWEAPNISFNDPADIAIHGDRAYVVERGNHRVQSLTLDGVPIEQWGSYGTIGDGQFNSPRGITVDAYGFVYVADTLNDRVQKFSPTGDYLAQFGESGSGNGQLNRPVRVDVAANGNVYVLDRDNARVQVFRPVN